METTKKIFLFYLAVEILAIAGTIEAEELMVRQPMQSEIGKTTTCPLMEDKFEVTKSTPVIDYKGKSYYYCCDSFIEDFKKPRQICKVSKQIVPGRMSPSSTASVWAPCLPDPSETHRCRN